MTLKKWAPPSLVRFCKGHVETISKEARERLIRLLSDPDMEHFWPEFGRRFPGREMDLYYAVEQALAADTRSISERTRDTEALETLMRDLQVKLEQAAPDLRGKDGGLLLEHLRYALKFKASSCRESIAHFTGLPDRTRKHHALTALVHAMVQEFPGLGRKMLARLATVSLGYEVDEQATGYALDKARERQKPDKANPLIRDAMSRMKSQ